LRLIDPHGVLTARPADTLLEEPAAEPAPAAAARTQAILVVSLDTATLPDLLAIAEPLASTEPRRELIAATLLEPSTVTVGVVELDRRHAVAREVLEAFRPRMSRSGIAYRTASLTSPHPARDLVRIAGSDRVDLILVDGRRPVVGREILGGPVRSVLEEAASDVAVLMRRG